MTSSMMELDFFFFGITFLIG